MTKAEILRRLRKTPRDWYLDSDGEIRRNDWPREQCPITSLIDLPAIRYRDVADELGLSEDVAECIANAADNFEVEGETKRWRADLLRACGLTEQP